MCFVKKFQNIFFLVVIGLVFSGLHAVLSDEARSKGFVYLDEVNPTIRISPRYASSENFVGIPIDGYTIQDHIVLTQQVAEALKCVQADVKKDGYCLVVYDAYRPQCAVDHFMRWSKDTRDQAKKSQYYPQVNKAEVFELGYVAEKSGHSRGSTVDVTLIEENKRLHSVVEKDCLLLDGFTIKVLDDGTVAMGSSFDLFDEASNYASDKIEQACKKMRAYLRTVMKNNGFKSCEQEWWHFTLNNELYPAGQESSYFNFLVE